jgi:hypothetical protein
VPETDLLEKNVIYNILIDYLNERGL